jgi:hypothetical protein
METLKKTLKDLEQGKISADHAEVVILRLFIVSGSVCCNADLIKFDTYGYDECSECGKTYRQQTDR